MTKLTILSLAAAAALLPSGAMAQSFEGPHAGVQLGWNHDSVDTSAASTGSVAVSDERDAFTGGVFAGYDHHVTRNVVLGVEGGIQIGADDEIAGADGRYSFDPRYSFDISARAGYVLKDRTLIYARGGYANTRARIHSISGTAAVKDQRNLDGWFVGGGAEHKLTDHISARLEYRYYDLGEDSDKFERHQVLAGVAYRF